MKIVLLLALLAIAFANECDERVEGHYLVRFKTKAAPDYTFPSDLQAWSSKTIGGGNVTHAWSFHTFRAFAGYFNDQELVRLRARPEVEEVEYDCIVHIPEYGRPELFHGPVETAQVPDLPGWGQYRSDQNTATYDSTGFIPFAPLNTAPAVTTWVLDTGIRTTHQEFADGRAILGANFIPTEPDGPNGNDGNGHGSHCAGTVAGINAGYGTSSRVGSVKVLANSGSGSWAGIIDGMQWVVDYQRINGGWNLMSMSLGGSFTKTVNDAVDAAAALFIPSICAAGNSNANVITFSPASASEAIAVAAIDQNNMIASFSNFGDRVEVGAPGVAIKSAWWTADDAYNTISGTSMACPAIAGQVAILIQALGQVPATSAIRTALQDYGTKGAIANFGSPKVLKSNLLGYDRWMG